MVSGAVLFSSKRSGDHDEWTEWLNDLDEMQTNCCYAIQDKTWVTDPDGNEWEVFVVLEDNLLETDYGIERCATTAQISCC